VVADDRERKGGRETLGDFSSLLSGGNTLIGGTIRSVHRILSRQRSFLWKTGTEGRQAKDIAISTRRRSISTNNMYISLGKHGSDGPLGKEI